MCGLLFILIVEKTCDHTDADTPRVMGGQNQVIRRSLLALATCVDLHGLATGQFEVGRQRIGDLGRVIHFSQQTPASEIDVFVLRCVGQLNVFAVGRTLVDVDGTWDERERRVGRCVEARLTDLWQIVEMLFWLAFQSG